MQECIRIDLSPIQGQGLFARVDLVAGQRVLQYRGEKITKAESARRCQEQNWRIFALDNTYDLDGDFPWNTARLINHSCAPNCAAELQEDKIWIIAQRPIAVGEEITFNYGYDWEDYRDHPCHCGAADCVGFIVAEEFFPQLRRQKNAGFLPLADAPPIGPATRHTNRAAAG